MTIRTNRDNVANLPAVVPNSGDNKGGGAKSKSPNVYIAQEQWDKMQKIGDLALNKLMRMLQHPNFNQLPVRDQLKAITMATDLAFKPDAALIRVDVTAAAGAATPEAANALKSLANRSLDMPEMAAARARTANVEK